MSTDALIQHVHTAGHVDQLFKNISVVLMLLEQIDKDLQDCINTLEEAVLFIGNQLNNVKIRLGVQCHSTFKCICVTLLPYNDAEHDWGQVQAHLQVIWNNSALFMDMDSLHHRISDIAQTPVASSSVETIDSFLLAICSYVGLTNSWFLFINLGINIFIILLFLFLFPVIIRQLTKSFWALTVKFYASQLRRKGGDGDVKCLAGAT